MSDFTSALPPLPSPAQPQASPTARATCLSRFVRTPRTGLSFVIYAVSFVREIHAFDHLSPTSRRFRAPGAAPPLTPFSLRAPLPYLSGVVTPPPRTPIPPTHPPTVPTRAFGRSMKRRRRWRRRAAEVCGRGRGERCASYLYRREGRQGRGDKRLPQRVPEVAAATSFRRKIRFMMRIRDGGEYRERVSILE